LQGVLGIADAIDVEWQADGLRRAQQKRFQLGAAFVVSPITDPDKALALGLNLRRMEQARVSRLVPDEDAAAPTPSPIHLGQGLAEGEDAVVALKVELTDRVRIADGAMMRIVEEEREARAAAALAPKGGYEPRLVPFVHDHDVGVRQGQVELEKILVGARAQLRIGVVIGLKARLAMILDEVLDAPRIDRLVGDDLVALGDQLAQDSTQEVRVAVVPAGSQRMREIDKPHAMPLSCDDACEAKSMRTDR
jgi:hypothetical protein